MIIIASVIRTPYGGFQHRARFRSLIRGTFGGFGWIGRLSRLGLPWDYEQNAAKRMRITVGRVEGFAATEAVTREVVSKATPTPPSVSYNYSDYCPHFNLKIR